MKPLGRLIVLILVVGLALGGWNVWQKSHGGTGIGAGPSTTGGGPREGTAGTGGPDNGNNIEFLTTATKQQWLQTEIDKFNAQQQDKPHVTLKLIESREAMQKILAGAERPTIWSPSSPVWITRLVDVWGQRHQGEHIAAFDDPADYRVFFKSPLVFVTTRQKAAYLRPVLSGPHPWEAVRRLSLGQQKTPWGTFRFSYADPLNASSGMLTMSLIISDYAQTHGQPGDLPAMTQTPAFAAYLQQMNRKFVAADTGGSTALEKAYVADPGSRDFITAYESKALEAVAENPDLVVIYPNPTANADQSAAVLSAPWVSDNQRAAAQAFLTFLAGSEAQRDGLTSHFRPAQPGGDISLTPQLAASAGRGFQQSYSAIELPPYEALNQAAAYWRATAAHQ